MNHTRYSQFLGGSRCAYSQTPGKRRIAQPVECGVAGAADEGAYVELAGGKQHFRRAVVKIEIQSIGLGADD